jgi:hypothetical protein
MVLPKNWMAQNPMFIFVHRHFPFEIAMFGVYPRHPIIYHIKLVIHTISSSYPIIPPFIDTEIRYESLALHINTTHRSWFTLFWELIETYRICLGFV